MNPSLEDFLEAAFTSIEPITSMIGRVVVEPDYESKESAGDSQQIRNELVELLKGQRLDSNALQSQDGLEISIPSRYQLLSKYVRRISLHADSVQGDWIEVAPPGYWI